MCVIVAIVTLSAIRVETRLSDHLVEIKDQPNMKVSDIPGRLWLIWSFDAAHILSPILSCYSQLIYLAVVW